MDRSLLISTAIYPGLLLQKRLVFIIFHSLSFASWDVQNQKNRSTSLF